MKNGSTQKLILSNSSSFQKQGFWGASHRFYLLSFLSAFALALVFLASLSNKRITPFYYSSSSPSPASASARFTPVPAHVHDALLHYSAMSNSSHISQTDLSSVAAALRRCPAPCKFLVFGLGHETLLWNALNHNGRTVFVDENEYYAAWYEQRNPHLEVYDVHYPSAAAQLPDLLAAARDKAATDCRPVQNLLFSDCGLAINDLPNPLYDIDWDVILVDGPRGYEPAAPGRISAIFSAAVMARSRSSGGSATSIFVHEFERALEKTCCEEFLCSENLVGSSVSLAHFAVGKADAGSFEFCRNRTSVKMN